MEDPLLDPKEPTEQGRDLDPSEKIIAKTEKEVVSETVKNSGTLDAKVAAAGQAVSSANDGEQKKILKEAVDQASPEAREALRQMLLPGQKAIDRIWQTVVGAFAFVLCASTLALIGAVFMIRTKAMLRSCLRYSPPLQASWQDSYPARRSAQR
jgi:hypothetical protein